VNERVAWVTGAGSGMGRASAIRAAAHGWAVALTGRRQEALEQTAEEITAAGGIALLAPADVHDAAALHAAHDRIGTELGAVGALVLSAGLNAPKRAWADQSMTEFQEIVQTNLTAVAATIDVALPELRATSGMVVVISSFAGWRFSPGAGVAYSASKTALSALCSSLNAQEAAAGVRACNLCPGDVDTDFLRLRPTVPGREARSVMLSPADVARAVQFVLDSPPHVRINELVITPTAQI
jgi:NADP-dependent 3-hydroxy acid dehydrogenase YdfG